VGLATWKCSYHKGGIEIDIFGTTDHYQLQEDKATQSAFLGNLSDNIRKSLPVWNPCNLTIIRSGLSHNYVDVVLD
jgi:hypothetical protein